MTTILPIDYGNPIMINFNDNNVKVEFFSDAKIPNVILELNNIINLDNDIRVDNYNFVYRDWLDILTSISNNYFILKIPINYSKKLTIFSSGKVVIENVDTDIDISICSKKVSLKNVKVKNVYVWDSQSLNISNCDIYNLQIENTVAKRRISNINNCDIYNLQIENTVVKRLISNINNCDIHNLEIHNAIAKIIKSDINYFYSYISKVNMTDINVKNKFSFENSNINIDNGKVLSLHGLNSNCNLYNLQIKNIEILRKGNIVLSHCDFLDESKIILEDGKIDLILEKGVHTKKNFKKNHLEIKKDRYSKATIITEKGKVKIKKERIKI